MRPPYLTTGEREREREREREGGREREKERKFIKLPIHNFFMSHVSMQGRCDVLLWLTDFSRAVLNYFTF